MKIINQYIIKTIFTYTLSVTLVWLVIFGFLDFLSDIDKIGVGEYGVLDELYVIVLNSPLLIYKNFSVIILIGVILALGYLANTSQLIIVRSAGMSILEVAKLTILFILFLVVCIALLGELVAPNMKAYAKNYQTRLLTGVVASNTTNNFWIKDGPYIVNIGKNYDGKNFANIKIFQFKQNRLSQVIQSQRMTLSNQQAILDNVSLYKIADNKINLSQHKKYQLDLLFDNKVLQTLKKKSLNLSIVDIYNQLAFLQTNNTNNSTFEVEMYQRLVKPLILITTILFSMLFIFGSLRNASMGKKLFLGVAISLFLELYLRISGAIVLKLDYSYGLVVVAPIMIALLVISRSLYHKSNI